MLRPRTERRPACGEATYLCANCPPCDPERLTRPLWCLPRVLSCPYCTRVHAALRQKRFAATRQPPLVAC